MYMCVSDDIFVGTLSGEHYCSYCAFTIYAIAENARVISHVNGWHKKVIATTAVTLASRF